MVCAPAMNLIFIAIERIPIDRDTRIYRPITLFGQKRL
jgi:hypothetical protein